MSRRRVASLALVGLGVDLFGIVVTGGHSVLGPWGGEVGAVGFAARSLAVGALLVLRFRRWAERPWETGRLALFLLLLPALAQFHFAGGRINGDGLMYYVYVRSIWKDADIDFTNEYTHYGLIERSDLAVPTTTGLRRSIFSIGPAVVGSPFFLAGEAAARIEAALGRDVDVSGYGPHHRNAVALGGLFWGFLAVVCLQSLVRRHFAAGVALFAALLAWGATFLHWYMVEQPVMSHAASAGMAALGVWLWDRDRDRRTGPGFVLLGLVLGVAMSVRWQNGVLLLLPGLDLFAQIVRDRRTLGRSVALGLATLAAAFVGAFPQMAAWKALYGMWVLPYPPHGVDFVRFDHPFVLETLFSSRHGLLSWTPVFWAGYLGFVPLLRRRPRLALPLLPLLVGMTYVNMCSGDWWAGGSFSNRRFDSLLPVFALGFAASLEVAARLVARRPELAMAGLLAPFVVWNVTVAEQTFDGRLPATDPVAFPRLARESAAFVSERAGSPWAWPANWVFAAEHSRPAWQYDLLVGRYLFYRQNNMQGRIDVGGPDDTALLGEGWGPLRRQDGVRSRSVEHEARLFAPLDVADELEIRVRASAREPALVEVDVNGAGVGRIRVEPALEFHVVRAPAAAWHREINDVVLRVGEGGPIDVDRVDFAPTGPRDWWKPRQ